MIEDEISAIFKSLFSSMMKFRATILSLFGSAWFMFDISSCDITTKIIVVLGMLVAYVIAESFVIISFVDDELADRFGEDWIDSINYYYEEQMQKLEDDDGPIIEYQPRVKIIATGEKIGTLDGEDLYDWVDGQRDGSDEVARYSYFERAKFADDGVAIVPNQNPEKYVVVNNAMYKRE